MDEDSEREDITADIEVMYGALRSLIGEEDAGIIFVEGLLKRRHDLTEVATVLATAVTYFAGVVEEYTHHPQSQTITDLFAAAKEGLQQAEGALS